MAHQVVHIIHNARPECSAQFRILATLAGGLDRDRYRLHCCFLQSDGPLSEELEQFGVHTYVVGWNGKRTDLAAAWKLFRYLRRIGVSIVHQHGGGLAGRLVARAAGVAANVLHLHTQVREDLDLTDVCLAPRATDAVIATSHAVAACVRTVKAQVIYPGVDAPSNPRAASKARCVIGTAARFVPVKGLEHLITAIALVRSEISDVRLQIAGSGPLQSQLELQVRKLGLAGCVEFVGWQAALQPWFKAWDIFALPSVNEGFGIAALEAMAAGLPVVATNVGGIPELVADGNTGWLVAPRDPESMAARLRQLLADPEERLRMGEAAQARVRSRFSAARMVTTTAALYEALIEAKVGHAAS